MRITKIVCILAFLILISGVFAQTNNSLMALEGFKVAHNDTLTSSYSGFVHMNWSQAGVGITFKRVLLMWNKTLFPIPYNFKADRGMDYVTSQTPVPDYKVNYRYDTIMAGYIVHMTRNLYPFAGTGTAIRTDYVEVTDPDENPDVYTVKGKEVSFATGVVGFFYTLDKSLVIEGSMQLNPVLPFVGIGYSF